MSFHIGVFGINVNTQKISPQEKKVHPSIVRRSVI